METQLSFSTPARGGSTLDWRSVQGRIAASTRTCSYDRAGYGFSDPSARPADARDAVDDLHRLVAAAKLGRPVILVGHSNGGLYASLYGETYPADTGGMVLVDPGFPGQQNYDAYGLSRAKAAELKAWTTSLVSKAAKCVRLAKAGALTTKHAGDNGCLDDPPNPDLAIHRTLDQQYASVAYQEANLSEFESSFAAIGGTTADDREMSLSPHALGAIPLIVLTASRHAAPISDFTPEDQAMFYSVWKHAHVRVAALSTAGRNVVVGGTGHFIQTDQPAAVVRAVEQVVDTVRHAQGAITPHD